MLNKIQEEIEDFIIDHKHVVFAVLFFSVFTLVLNSSLLKTFTTAVPFLDADTYQAMGLVMEQSSILKEEGFFSGIKTIVESKDPGIITVYALLSNLLGDFSIAYNSMYFLSFILSGVGVFLLIRYCTHSTSAGLLGGIIYAFAPYHFYHATETHIGAMHQEWLPFFAYFLFRFFEKFKPKYFFLTLFFAFLITITEHQKLAFTIVFTILVTLFQLVFRPKAVLFNWRPWVYALVSAVLLWGAILLFFGSYLKVATSENNFLDAGIDQAKRYSITPIDILIPPQTHYTFGDHYRTQIIHYFQERYTFSILDKGEDNSSSFVGYTTLTLLALLPLVTVFWFIRFPWRRSRWIVFWISATTLFYVLAMGPEIDTANGPVTLPYNLIYENVPFFENIRTVGRFFVYSLLGIAVCAGYVFATFFGWKRWLGFVALIPFSALLLLELHPGTIKTYSFTYSPLYDQIAQDSDPYTLLEIPGSSSYEFVSYQMMTDPIHKKRTLGGKAIARSIDKQFEEEKKTPVISDLLYEIASGNDPLEKAGPVMIDTQSVGLDILNHYRVGYVILNASFLEEEDRVDARTQFIRYMEDNFPGIERYEDDWIIAYKIPQKTPTGVFPATYNYEDLWDDFTRETRGEKRRYGEALPGAPVTLVNMSAEPIEVTASFDMKSDNYVDKITVKDADGNTLKEQFIGPESWDPVTFSLTVFPGKTQYTIHYSKTILETVMISNIRVKYTQP